MKLSEIVPWGRTLAEYKSMFNLSKTDLNMRILGCGDGPASFNAEMTEQGFTVISIDPIYQFSAKQIKKRIQETYKLVISQVKQNPEHYIWKNFRDAEELGQARLAAMDKFLLDYEAGKATGRYLYQSLPSLDLADEQFQLCLCSHLLFLYSEQLSFDFHLASIQELLRISSEVRIFPLFDLNGKRSAYLESVIQKLLSKDFNVEIESVSYEFQKGANQMLKITNIKLRS